MIAGTQLGPYEIVAPLGAGGMGEVYRARDRRLDRSVAVKILPPEFSGNSQLKLRFNREAKTISQLNHPNICTLYDVGHENGTDYLVMELIEGESLADRLLRGPLPLPEVIRYGAEIASALEKAHRHGIVHRDLKPGNVMLTKTGAKLLDFGLARTQSAVISSPQIETEQKPLTADGVIVGTFRYMSPEQLEGQTVDHRSDIFAMGALLYEMATGRRAFDGKSRTSIIAAIVSSQPPPLSQVQPLTPPALERLIGACLAKDPDARIQSAHDVALELRWIADGEVDTKPQRRATWLPWAVAGVLAAALIALVAARSLRTDTPPAPIRFSIPAPPQTALYGIPAISPDGRNIVFSTMGIEKPQMLWLRSLDTLEAKPLKGTEDANHVFWSPDGRSIGFTARGRLWRLDLGDGSVRVLHDPVERLPGGGTWNQKDVILFSPNAEGQLYRLAASGGEAVRVSQGDAVEIWPWFLPDGDHFLYFRRERPTGGIYVGSLSSPERKLLINIKDITPSRAAYANGFILWNRGNQLYAQAFDLGKLELSGDPRKIEDEIEWYAPAHAAFSVSEAGTLVYHPAGAPVVSQLTFVDRNGGETGTTGPVAAYGEVRLSPDQRRIVTSRSDTGSSVWMLDVARGAPSRISFEAWAGMPVWTPDSRGIVYSAAVDMPPDLFHWRDGAITRLTRTPLQYYPSDVTPDGKLAIAEVFHPDTEMDIYAVPLAPPHTPVPLVKTKFREREGTVSPDGRWLAYCSNETGKMQVYTVAMPGTGPRVQISTDGGYNPRWSADGRTLYYADPAQEAIAEVSIAVQAGELRPSAPVRVIAHTSGEYDVTRDGRFLVSKQRLNPDSPPLTVITNWTASLK